ncbi:DUF433 domain-containing protein [Isosphaeraceae bacterium EP7]
MDCGLNFNDPTANCNFLGRNSEGMNRFDGGSLPAGLPDTTADSPSIEFEAYAAAVRRRLGAIDSLEQILAERVVIASWNLWVATREELLWLKAEASIEAGDDLLRATFDAVRRDVVRAERSLDRAIEGLERVRQLTREPVVADEPRTPSRAARTLARPPVEAAEECEGETAEPKADDDTCTEVEGAWSDRLVFDADISEASPVVKGTWVTVTQVVSRVVDGWSWAEILRGYPELSEADIRACLDYSVDEMQGPTL